MSTTRKKPDQESAILKLERAELSKIGVTTFRNSVGACIDSRSGNFIRYGLAEGSSDIIGWTSHTIRPEDVGRRVAIFTAIETKTKTGKVSDAQDNFLSRLQLAGGISGVSRQVGDAVSIVKKWRGE